MMIASVREVNEARNSIFGRARLPRSPKSRRSSALRNFQWLRDKAHSMDFSSQTHGISTKPDILACKDTQLRPQKCSDFVRCCLPTHRSPPSLPVDVKVGGSENSPNIAAHTCWLPIGMFNLIVVIIPQLKCHPICCPR